VAKNEGRSSRRVDNTQKTGNSFFQRMRNFVRPKKIAPIPVIKQEPDVLKNISRRSRTSNKMSFDDNKIYSPFDLELPRSTSRNRTSKRSLLREPDEAELERMYNLLQQLDSSPKILNHLTLKKYLNGQYKDASGITEIKLYGKDLPKTPIYNKIIELLTLTLQQSNKIETIEIDVPYLIPVILELESEPRKLSTIQGIKKLILRSDYEYHKPITDDVIFVLLSMIGKMENLEELEFSQFAIDVSNFKGGITFNDLFRSIVRLKKLENITFNGNVFTDNVKEGEFDSFVETLNKSDKQDKMSVILHWIKKNYILDDIDFRYYKWVEYLNELFLANIGNKNQDCLLNQ
jgi:hypothetical protein